MRTYTLKATNLTFVELIPAYRGSIGCASIYLSAVGRAHRGTWGLVTERMPEHMAEKFIRQEHWCMEAASYLTYVFAHFHQSRDQRYDDYGEPVEYQSFRENLGNRARSFADHPTHITFYDLTTSVIGYLAEAAFVMRLLAGSRKIGLGGYSQFGDLNLAGAPTTEFYIGSVASDYGWLIEFPDNFSWTTQLTEPVGNWNNLVLPPLLYCPN